MTNHSTQAYELAKCAWFAQFLSFQRVIHHASSGLVSLASMPFTGWPDEVTAKDIAKALDISDKTLRSWLRKNPQPVIHAHSDLWIVTPAEADAIVAAYRSRK
jgi:hypothetical protein